MGTIKFFFPGILSADREEQLIAVQTAADILSDCEISTIDLLITAGVIPKLVEFLGFDDKYILKFILFSTHKYEIPNNNFL